jgi:hypothetical protein
LQPFICASDKTDGTADEDVVEIKSAVLYTVDVVLVNKSRMHEIEIGNKNVVNVASGFGGLGVVCWPLVPKFAGSDF